MAASTLTGKNPPTTSCQTFSGSVTSATDIIALDVSAFDRLSVQVTSAGSTCTVSYEVSNNNNDWVSIAGYAPSTPQTETSTTSTATGTLVFRCDSRYFRARVSTYGSGTVSVVIFATAIYADA